MALAASTGQAQAASMAFELVSRGRESAAALESLLQGASVPAAPPHGGLQLKELAAQILRCCDRALDALQGDGGCPSRKRRPPPCTAAQRKHGFRPRVLARGAEVPARVEKRCMPEDGFLWRKYGQKDIQNSKYPREYFRCTNKYNKGCIATRQVQQSEDNPSLYVVAYFGEHTCGKDAAVAAVDDDDKVQKSLVNNLGSNSASSVSSISCWPSSFGDNNVKSEASQALQAVCFSEGGEHREVCKVEPVTAPMAGLSSAATDVSCASPTPELELEALLRYFNCFGESPFDII